MDTLERLGEVTGKLRSTLDKLKGVKAGLVRGNEGWRDWDFKDLLRELISVKGLSNPKQTKPTRVLKTHSQQETRTGNQQCVDWEDQNHRSPNCTKVTKSGERRRILSEKRQCYNCNGGKYRSDKCKSGLRYHKCSCKHHTAICNTRVNDTKPVLGAAGTTNARLTYPAVVVEVKGVKCPPLLDKCGGSLYASSVLLNRISTRKRNKEVTEIEILLRSSPQKVELVTIEIGEINREFAMPVKVTIVNKGNLLFPDNPNYEETIAKNPYLSGVVMNDQDKKSRLPVHPIRGTGECAKLKTESVPKIGEPGEHVTKLTIFSWVIMSPGKEPQDIINMLLTQTSRVDY